MTYCQQGTGQVSEGAMEERDKIHEALQSSRNSHTENWMRAETTNPDMRKDEGDPRHPSPGLQ